LPGNLSESQIIKIWQRQLLNGAELVTEDGVPIEIIYPGRINDERGADFRDAVIAINRRLIKGDVEIHVRSSGWRDHKHHQDVSYNRVVLHVVMWHNTKTATRLQNGREVPVLALHKYIKIPPIELPNSISSNIPCLKAAQSLDAGSIAEFLDNSGEERFLIKAARFQRELAHIEASQSLYQGIMGALGYSRNKLPMLKLAHSLPLHVLESTAHGKHSDKEYLLWQQALLLGAAGLLSAQHQGRCPKNRLNSQGIDDLERLSTSFHHEKVMSFDAWHLFKVRPINSPIRRLIGMSYLLLRYRKEGLFKGLVGLIKEVSADRSCHRLEKGLMVTINCYCAGHFDFGFASRVRSPTLIGRGRAADIVVNVLLPFTFAWSGFTSRPELGEEAVDLYRCYPRLTENSVERHMTDQLGLNKGLVNSAQRQQGLIHIYNNLCTQGRCNDCRLSQLKAGHHIQI